MKLNIPSKSHRKEVDWEKEAEHAEWLQITE